MISHTESQEVIQRNKQSMTVSHDRKLADEEEEDGGSFNIPAVREKDKGGAVVILKCPIL